MPTRTRLAGTRKKRPALFPRLFCMALLSGPLAFLACHSQKENPGQCSVARPDYSQHAFWFKDSGDSPVDVFYIVPTCVFDWQNGNRIEHHADPGKEAHRQAMHENMLAGKEIFGQQCNFFSPYYRQITLECWSLEKAESMVETLFPVAREDVLQAFSRYMEHSNQGRPFILAGFSQGGKAVVEILKTLREEELERLVAAYAIGYKVEPEEARQYPLQLVPAQDSTDTGVTICYNSASEYEALPAVFKPNLFCINPLNWQTGTAPARLYDSLVVHCDTVNRFLQVEGVPDGAFFRPELSYLFPEGCYHLWELEFYKTALQENVARRCHHYRLQHPR